MRNYEKEAAWQKEKYARLAAYVEKETVAALKAQLAKDDLSYTAWLKNQISKYLDP